MADALLSDADVGLAPASAPAAPTPTAASPAPASSAAPATSPSSSSAAPAADPAPSTLTIRRSQPPAVMSDADVGLAPSSSAAAAAQGQGPLGNTQDDSWTSGGIKGAATGIIKGLAHIPGWIGDTDDLATFLASGAASLFDSRSASDIYKSMKAKSAALPSLLQSPGTLAPNAADIAAPVLAKTGEYKPTSELGSLAQAGVEAAAGGLGPGAGTLTKGASAGKALVSTLAHVPLNAVAGVAGQGATDATGNPYLGLAASVIAPTAGEQAGRIGAKVMSPAIEDVPGIGRAFPNQREINVGNQILHDSTNPDAVKAFAQTGITPDGDAMTLPGPSPTTGAVLGDRGLLNRQRDLMRDPTSGMAEHAEGQNAAQLAGLQSLASDSADAMLPSRMLQQHLGAVDDASNLAVQKLVQHAQALAAPIKGAQPAEASGAQLRDAIQRVSEQQKAIHTAAYDAVDPHGTVIAATDPVTGAAKGVSDAMGQYDEPFSATEKHLFGLASGMPATLPYKDLVAFDRQINSALPDATGVAKKRLGALKDGIMDALNGAADNQHVLDQSAVASGAMAPGDTLEARVRSLWNVPDARVATGNAGGVGAGNRGPSARSTLTPAGGSGAGVSARGRPGQATGDQGISSSAPPTGDAPAAADRLSAAKQAYVDYTKTYGQGPVGRTMDTNGYKGQFSALDSAVPSQVVMPGPKGYQVARSYIDALKGDASGLDAIEHMTMLPLQKALTPEGTVSPTGLADFKTKYAGALKALDEARPGFSARFDSPAKATQAATEYGALREQRLDEFRQSAGAKLLGKMDPVEAQNEIMGMIRDGKNGPTKLRQLMAQTAGNPDAQEGIRKLARDALIRQMTNVSEAGVSGDKKVSNAGIDKLMTNNRAALEAIFPPDSVNRIGMVAKSLQLNNRDVTAGTIKASAADRARDITHALGDKLSHSSAAHAGIGAVLGEQLLEHMHNPAMLATAGTGAAALYALNKLRSKGQAVQNVMYHDAIKDPLLAQRYVSRALDAKGVNGNAKAVASAVRRSLISTPIVKGSYQAQQ